MSIDDQAIVDESIRNTRRLMRDVDELRGEEKSAPLRVYQGAVSAPLLLSEVIAMLGAAVDYYNGFEAVITDGTLAYRVIALNGQWMAQPYSLIL